MVKWLAYTWDFQSYAWWSRENTVSHLPLGHQTAHERGTGWYWASICTAGQQSVVLQVCRHTDAYNVCIKTPTGQGDQDYLNSKGLFINTFLGILAPKMTPESWKRTETDTLLEYPIPSLLIARDNIICLPLNHPVLKGAKCQVDYCASWSQYSDTQWTLRLLHLCRP